MSTENPFQGPCNPNKKNKNLQTCNPRDPNRIIGSREGDRDLLRLEPLDAPDDARVGCRQINCVATQALIKGDGDRNEGSIKGGRDGLCRGRDCARRKQRDQSK